MSQNTIQGSFAAGEISQSLYARVDLAKYHTALKRCRNYFVDYRGGVTNRAGTSFVAEVYNPGQNVRLVPFQFSTEQTYLLEFGHLYMRVIKDGGLVLEPSKNVTAVSGGVVTVLGHGWSVGNWVYLTGVGDLDNGFYRVSAVATNTITVTRVDTGTVSNVSTTVVGATAARVYMMTTPYTGDDVLSLKYTQSADTLTIVHPEYRPQNVVRFAHDNWVIQDIQPEVPSAPTGVIANYSTAGSTFYAYRVTTVDKNGNESVGSVPFEIANAANMSATQATVTSQWAPVAGAAYYNIYRTTPSLASIQFGANYGFIGSTQSLTFVDANIVADFTKTPPLNNYPFAANSIDWVEVVQQGAGNIPTNWPINLTATSGSGASIAAIITGGYPRAVVVEYGGEDYVNPVAELQGENPPGTPFTAELAVHLGPSTGTYPSVVTYFQQRRVFAASTNKPATFWMSQIGSFNNFGKSTPIRDTDMISGTLASTQVNDIKWLVPMPSGLIVLTSGSAWQIGGGAANAPVTPKSITATPQAYTGAGDVDPIVINYDILYVQSLGSIVRDLSYNFYANVYTGVDMTILSNHLFYGRQIVSWAYAEEPHKIIWTIRDDGKLLSFTFVKEQDVYGWALHETDGNFLWVETIPEGLENVPYFIIERTINGRTSKYIERMESRNITALTDSWFVDCGAVYTGAPATTIRGLWHLEGKTVAVLADGLNVGPKVVANGRITLTTAASKVVVGLPYVSEGQTLAMEPVGGGGTMQGKRKNPKVINLRVEDTVGMVAGPDFGRLDEFKMYEPGAVPVVPGQMITGDIRLTASSGYNTEGSICWRQTEPLPSKVNGVILEVAFGDMGQ